MQPTISYTHAEYTHSPLHHTLTMYVGSSICCFAVLDAEQVVQVLQKYTLPHNDIVALINFFNNNTYLQQQYNHTSIAYSTEHSTLVPNAYYNYDLLHTYLNVQYGDLHQAKAFSDNVPNLKAHLIYRINKELVRTTIRKFVTATTCHIQSKMLQYNEPTTTSTTLQVLYLEDCVVAALYTGTQLQCSKTLAVTNNDTLTYQLLHMCQAYDVHVDEVVVQLSGWLIIHSPLYNALYKYFTHIQFMQDVELTTPNDVAYEKHFFTLFQLIAKN